MLFVSSRVPQRGHRVVLADWIAKRKGVSGKGDSKSSSDDTMLSVGAHLSEQLMYLTDKVKRQQQTLTATEGENKQQLLIVEFAA